MPAIPVPQSLNQSNYNLSQRVFTPVNLIETAYRDDTYVQTLENPITKHIRNSSSQERFWMLRIIGSRMYNTTKDERFLSKDPLEVANTFIGFLQTHGINIQRDDLWNKAADWQDINFKYKLIQRSDFDNLYLSHLTYE